MLTYFLLVGFAHADDALAQLAFEARIRRMDVAVARVVDAEFTFHQREIVGGVQQPGNEMRVKFRRPQDIYMEWVGEAHLGRQLIYREGLNNGKLIVDPGPWIPSVWLDPTGSLATSGQRHNVYYMGFVALSKLFSADADRVRADPVRLNPDVTDYGVSSEYGEPVHCYTTELPKHLEPAFYAAKARVCFSERTDLPVRIQAWEIEGAEQRMVEDYGYEGARINVGLTDLDFDPNNPDYAF